MKSIGRFLFPLAIFFMAGFSTGALAETFSNCFTTGTPIIGLVPVPTWTPDDACLMPPSANTTSGFGTMQVLTNVDPDLVTPPTDAPGYPNPSVPPAVQLQSGGSEPTAAVCGSYVTGLCPLSVGAGSASTGTFGDTYQFPFSAFIIDSAPNGFSTITTLYVGNSFIGTSPYYGFASTSNSTMIFDDVTPDYPMADGGGGDPSSPGVSPCMDTSGNVYWVVCINNQ